MSSEHILEFTVLARTTDLDSVLPVIDQSLRDRFGKILLGWAFSTDPETAGNIRGWFRSVKEDDALGYFSAHFDFEEENSDQEPPEAYSSFRVFMEKGDV